ncbi:MAG: universal stress protein [Planctomycetia bacterium]|nr:universal stress protein [Planctomycetia bacterium]
MGLADDWLRGRPDTFREAMVMTAKTILFPTDFSTASDAALVHAEALARQSDAKLLILHIEEPPLAYGGGELYYGLPEPSSERILQMLEDVRPSDTTLPFEHRLVMGDPAAEIVAVAQAERAELVVMGTHGRGVIIIDDISPLRDLTPEILNKNVHLFDIKPTVINEKSDFGGNFGTETQFVGANPSRDVQIKYQRWTH